MQYSPKLKTAMERIKAVMKEYDLGGTVFLHTPGFSEYYNKFDPSYSLIRINGNEVRFRAKLKEDFDGDKIKWQQGITDTVNLIMHSAEISHQTLTLAEGFMNQLKGKIDIEKSSGSGYSSHTTQNN